MFDLELHGPAETRLERRVVGRDVGTPGAIAFLEPQRFEGAVADRADAVRLARRHQRVEHVAGRGDRHMQLPAELADIGDAQRADRRGRRSRSRAHGRTGRPSFETSALVTARSMSRALGPISDSVPNSSVTSVELGVEAGADVVADPGEIMGAEAGAGDDVEIVFGKPRDGQVALDAAARVEQLRIGQPARPAWRRRWRRSSRAPSAHPCRSARIWRRRTGRRCRPLRAHARCSSPTGAEPVLPAHRIDVAAARCRRRKPVRPLPAELRAEHRACVFQPLIERRDDARPAALIFLMREADRVVLAIGFERAVAHPVAVAVQIGEAADVDDPQIERRFARHHPFAPAPSRRRRRTRCRRR